MIKRGKTQPKNQKSKFWKGHGQISGEFFSRLKRKAKQRGIEFDLTIEYLWQVFIEQGGRCAFTGTKLSFPKSSKKMHSRRATASLDRIYSNKPYVKGNVQWTHKKINLMKYTMRPQDFVAWCHRVSKFFIEKKGV